MNDLVKSKTNAMIDTLGGIHAISANIRKTTQGISAGGNNAFLKMTRAGEWVFGSENIDVEPDSEWAINIMSASTGWAGWGDKEHGTAGKPQGERFANVIRGEPAIAFEDLPEIPGTWSEAVSLDMKCLTDHDDVDVTWKSNSKGALAAFKTVMDTVADRVDAGNLFIMPIVRLKTNDYKHDSYGTIYNPVFEIVDWVDMEGNFEDEDSPAQAPVEAAPEPEPEVTPAAPKKRRRRKTATA